MTIPTYLKTPSEVAAIYDAVDEVDVPNSVSWVDVERDLSAWLGKLKAIHLCYSSCCAIS